MGPQSSKSPDGSKKDYSPLMRENHSSYQGIKTETTDSKGSISGGSLRSKDDDENNNNAQPHHDAKLPTVFEWREGGNTVYVTGTFCGWTQFFIMSKQSNGSFQLTLDLPRGLHQYKFKVDDVWKFSNFHPTFLDNNNVNNFVDTTKVDIPIKEDSPQKQKNNINGKKEITPSVDVYSNHYPKKEELNTVCPLAPAQYVNVIHVDYNSQESIETNEMGLAINEYYSLSDSNCYKAIPIPTHVNL